MQSSTTPSGGSRTIESEAWDRREIERQLYLASRAGVSRTDFGAAFLGRLREACSAAGAAIWHDPGGDALYLFQQSEFPVQQIREAEEAWRRHGRLLRLVRAGSAQSYAPGWTDGRAENPCDGTLLIAAAPLGTSARVVVELLRGSTSPEAHNDEDCVALLRPAAEFAADYLAFQFAADQARSGTRDERRWEFVKRIHQSLDPTEVAFIVANAGALLTEADRVSVLIRRRKRSRVAAITGQAAVNRRANQVRLLEALGTRVMQANAPVVAGSGGELHCPEQVRGALQAYRQTAGSAVLLAAPLREADPGRPPLGAVVIERMTGAPSARLNQDADFLAEHAAMALGNAARHDRILFRSWRSALGRMLRESAQARFWGVLTVLAVATGVLWLTPWPLRLQARGALRAADRRGLYAPEDGVVQEVYATHNRRVAAGDPVAILENNDLRAQHHQVLEELGAVRQQRAVLEAERSGRPASTQRQLLLDGEIMELAEREKSLSEQEQLLSRRLETLLVTAPIDGWIATWEPERVLSHRPVQQGNLLVQVIAADADWELQLEVDDADSGYVLEAWSQREQESAAIPVEYVLSTHPERTYRGWLTDVAPRTESIAGRHVIPVKVKPDEGDPPPLRDGATVRAKIHCGERSLGFVMFREVIEFVQARVLF